MKFICINILCVWSWLLGSLYLVYSTSNDVESLKCDSNLFLMVYNIHYTWFINLSCSNSSYNTEDTQPLSLTILPTIKTDSNNNHEYQNSDLCVHNFTVRSNPAETIRCSSGLKSQDITLPTWAVRVCNNLQQIIEQQK